MEEAWGFYKEFTGMFQRSAQRTKQTEVFVKDLEQLLFSFSGSLQQLMDRNSDGFFETGTFLKLRRTEPPAGWLPEQNRSLLPFSLPPNKKRSGVAPLNVQRQLPFHYLSTPSCYFSVNRQKILGHPHRPVATTHPPVQIPTTIPQLLHKNDPQQARDRTGH